MGVIAYDDSILASIKRLMPKSSVPENYTIFDDELIAYINTELAILQQLGVGDPNQIFVVTGTQDRWSDYLTSPELLSIVPQYVAIRVKVMFDASSSSVVVEQLKDKAKELEFRLQDAAIRENKRREESDGGHNT